MIPKKPKKTEDQFLRGSNGSSSIIQNRPRLPEDLYQRLKDLAWDRRITVNALIVEILEDALAKAHKKGKA